MAKRIYEAQKDKTLPFYLRYLLTVDEAAAYFYINVIKISNRTA